MKCESDKTCLFCEYCSPMVDLILDKGINKIVLQGMYCSLYNKYSLPRFNNLKDNPFDNNIIKGELCNKIEEYYDNIESCMVNTVKEIEK